MGAETTHRVDDFTEVTTFQLLEDLFKRHKLFSENLSGYSYRISEIYESPISYSFRVFDMETLTTKYFLQKLKE